MLLTTLLSLLTCLDLLRVVATEVINTYDITVYADRAWSGESLQNVTDTSLMECAVTCADRGGDRACNAANYAPERRECELLSVASVDDDWREVDDGTQMVTHMDADLTACVGFWPFDGDVASLWRTTTIATPSPLVVFETVQGDTQAVRFLRDPNCFIELHNHGDLIVTEFTWAAKIYPDWNWKIFFATLFTWEFPASISDSRCGNSNIGLEISLFFYELTFMYCNGEHLTSYSSSQPVDMDMWHDVAVAYNTLTGALQLRVDGVTETYTTGETVPGITAGNVRMGSGFDFRSFNGSIACMRIWNTARNLTLLQDSPLCNIH